MEEDLILKIPRKLEEVQEWMVSAGLAISSSNHRNRELKEEIEEIKEDLENINSSLANISKSIIEYNIKIDNIKSGMDNVEKKFTWIKIFTSFMAIITVCAGAISTMVVILNNLGILKVIK